jgi:antitoxin component of MazEF toxin-antitoxin module
MSTTTQPVRDESMSRVLLAKKELYQSGNSLSVSIPPDVLENTPFDVGDPANIFSVIEDRELTITADTRRWMDAGARARGSRKIRESSHGTVLITIPPEALEHDLGYETVEAAKGVTVRLTIDPATADLFLEFPDE